jgi:hypothetical protein
MSASTSAPPTPCKPSDELAQAGLSPGKIQLPSRGGSRVTTFYCNAPGGVVIEIATPPGLAAE